MKRRIPPRTVSKRFARKLRRAKNPFLLWLQCKQPHKYARLRRLWRCRFWTEIFVIDPIDTPFFSSLPRTPSSMLHHEWALDELRPM